MEELDDWELSAEDLDFLEKDAINKLSQKKTSPAIAPCPSSASAVVPLQLANTKNPPSRNFEQSPSASASADSCYGRVEGASPSRSHASRENDSNSACDLPKLSVQLYLHASGAIAAKFLHHTLLVEAFHRIPKAFWHGKERVWMFPVSSLATAEEVLRGATGVIVEVQKLDPLVCRALNAASAVPDRGGALWRTKRVKHDYQHNKQQLVVPYGEQKELNVTINITSSSPAKPKASPGKPKASPGKQQTLDAFLKRCPGAPDASTKAQEQKF